MEELVFNTDKNENDWLTSLKIMEYVYSLYKYTSYPSYAIIMSELERLGL